MAAKGKISLTAAISLGIGSMIGAGIFVLLGQVGAVVGAATWISFLLAGIIIIFCGYNFAKLGARYPSNGGVLEYLVQAYGINLYSGGMGVFYYIASIILMAVVAKGFGFYLSALVMKNPPSYLPNTFAVCLVLLLTLLNFISVSAIARFEKWIVAIKLLVIISFAVLGFAFVKPSLLANFDQFSSANLFSSLALTFFAYTGFNVISGSAENMDNPKKNVPRAIMLTIFIVMIIYIALALVVFGNLSVDQVIAAKETALAEAARPALGETGFAIVSIAALFSSVSSINANIFASSNNAYVMAVYGTLPKAIEKRVWRRGTEALVVTSSIIIILLLLFDLTLIASVGGLASLIAYTAVNIAHLRLYKDTGAKLYIVWLSVLISLGTVIVVLLANAKTEPGQLYATVIIIVLSFLFEWIMRTYGKKYMEEALPRVQDPIPPKN
ncbi:amino acid permease-like protein [Chitinophaga skermanii]|uniref:Amino acid permease-like protein n=1 Tax=Chitinophaga skermanii TaxID=331697 RepID=A0A327R481_9BACT|nr:APC family permease [Chitinophaga skermanii]RAJ10752.1 amino acid permease-like protein [Chitinophaga skermanii]